MILIEDLLDVIEIIVVLGLLVPRGIDEGVDVVKDERAFKRSLRHHLETLELFVDLVFDVLRIWVLRHFLLDGIDIAFLVVAFAKFIADGFHLFSKDVFFLRSLGAVSHGLIELFVDLTHGLGFVQKLSDLK